MTEILTLRCRRFFIVGWLLFCFCWLGAYSQKQGNIWYFGNHAGLDFNGGIPVPLIDGQTYSPDPNSLVIEGTAVISDSSGALLFYSNGTKIWNKNQQIMPNGDSLLGNFSSTQSALIVAQPGSSRYFYVFTTSDMYYQNLQYGFRYSMVDICLDGGLGDVITNQKNILILDTVAEKLTAVRHANGIDYWIIVHKYYSDAFYSYHLSSAGLIDTVISHVGSRHPLNSNPNITAYAIGYLKASPNGQKLCCVSSNGYCIAEYFDFDKSTGIVSNRVNIQPDTIYMYYGVSFSPDNSKLYIAGDLNDYNVYQYNLNAWGGNPDSVKASRTPIAIQNINYFALQLATDGKIYVTRGNPSAYVGVINFPNNLGVSCNYVDSAVYLNGKTASYGLPNFIDSYDYSNTISPNCSSILTASFQSTDTNICVEANNCINFTDYSGGNPTSWQWLFPGATPDTSSQQNPTNICYYNVGTYPVTLIVTNAAGSDTLTVSPMITVGSAPQQPVITVVGDTLYSSHAAYYQWYFNGAPIPNATDSFYIASQGGTYSVQVTDGTGCNSLSAGLAVGIDELQSSSFQLQVFPNPARDEITIYGLTPNPSPKERGAGATIEIYDVLEENVYSKQIEAGNTKQVTINCKSFAAGIYFIKVANEKVNFVAKFVKE